jgi:gamma-glutamyl hercynylcysteine S-oxide synthase
MIAKTTTSTHLVQMLAQARAATDALFGMVRPGAFHDRPVPERHRTIFYFGHLEAFDWNLVSQAAGAPSFHPEFDQRFAFGIDPEPGQLPQDKRSDWPETAEVQQYNLRVRQAIDDLSNQVSEQMLSVALEHRLMHAETLPISSITCRPRKRIFRWSRHFHQAQLPFVRSLKFLAAW